MSEPALWQDISTKAQAILADSIPVEWRISQDKLPPVSRLDVTGFPAESGLLSQDELDITESTASEVITKLHKGEWSAENVTIAFCKRAAIAHQLTNCLTVIMFDDAIQRAKLLDQHFKQTGTLKGPLHGLPISLKDGFNIPGYPSSVGFSAWALEKLETESSIVTTLKELGAVPYVKTNVPTAMMIAESVNNVYGRTLNPQNRNTTSGGSSGGESALLAMRGSCLGVGTDIGGSIRIPSACVGIFGLKPSLGRFPHFDSRTGLAGQESIASIQGPMARSLADLQLWAASVVGSEPWRRDPKCLPIPWRTDVAQSLPAKLKFGVLWDNTITKPLPPVTRALTHVVERLRLAGHQVIDWPADDHREALLLMRDFFLADGGTSVSKLLDATQEPVRPEMATYASATGIDTYALWQVQKARTALQKRYLDRFVASGIDAILGPVTPYAGTARNEELKSVDYTGVFNVLDYASVSFPTGLKVDEGVDEKTATIEGYTPRNEVDGLTQEQYDVKDFHGLPISLQVTAGRLEEEKVLAVTERILECLK